MKAHKFRYTDYEGTADWLVGEDSGETKNISLRLYKCVYVSLVCTRRRISLWYV